MIQLIQHRYDARTDCVTGLAENSQRVIFADPPYNIGVKYADDPLRDRMSDEAYQAWCRLTMIQLEKHLMPGGTLWWLCPAAHVDFIGPMLSKHVGARLYLIVKVETFAQYQQKTLTEDYRFLFCHTKPAGTAKSVQELGKDLRVFNPDEIRVPSKRQEVYGDKRADPRGRVPGQIWTVRRLQGTSNDRVDWHPCQLPPELLERIVKGWSNPGDSVMDAFAGSGNMGMICRQLNRDSILVDGSPTYIAKMKERLSL